jgi:peptide/nickel transport system permease protein
VGRYLARKSGFYLITFVVAVTVDWAIPRFMPGDPIQGLISRMQAQPGSTEALTGYYTEAFGLDVPIWQQYLNFWAGLLQGDLGTSVWQYPTPVTDLIMNAIPYTLAACGRSGTPAGGAAGRPTAATRCSRACGGTTSR